MRFGMGLGLGLGAQRRAGIADEVSVTFNSTITAGNWKLAWTGQPTNGNDTFSTDNLAILVNAGYVSISGAGTPKARFAAPSGSLGYRWEFSDVANGTMLTIKKFSYLTLIHVNGAATWAIIGALPTGLTYLLMAVGAPTWDYAEALPSGLTYLYLGADSINWTGLEIGGAANMTAFALLNYRITKLSTAELLIMLASLAARSGSLPNTITINDYADYASPPQEVTDAVDYLKQQKPNITSVALGA